MNTGACVQSPEGWEVELASAVHAGSINEQNHYFNGRLLPPVHWIIATKKKQTQSPNFNFKISEFLNVKHTNTHTHTKE